jgi:hypothetical protein
LFGASVSVANQTRLILLSISLKGARNSDAQWQMRSRASANRASEVMSPLVPRSP